MKRIFNKKIGVLIFSLVCAGLANAAPVRNADEAVELVEESIINHGFGGNQGTECMKFYVDETDDEFEIDVHSDNEKCGGDSSVEPRLFSYTVNKETGELATDNMSYAEDQGVDWEGDFLPID
ncbi:hypothetical protein [Leptotrichia alba]|uniref:Uncharacterized protein n=1 Tax=Leptotrichia alba TaxID=3239304 RepID=A0AB39V2A1_9FUSO